MKHLDLFSGIGGFALAAQWVWGDDHEVVAFCEKDEYCRQVLAKHWPDVPIVEDIRDVKATTHAHGDSESIVPIHDKEGSWELGERIDIVTGGFPCQPFSQAGKRDGRSDDRHLWPEMLRVIRLFTPRWVIAENVRGILSIEDGMVFEQVCLDLENSGYEVQPFVIPSVAVDAHHRRDRVWFVAHTERTGAGGKSEDVSDSGCERIQQRRQLTNAEEGNPGSRGMVEDGVQEGCRPEREDMADTEDVSNGDKSRLEKRQRKDSGTAGSIGRAQLSGVSRWIPEPGVGRVANGVPRRVDRLRGLGNAIVPQVAEKIMITMKEIDEQNGILPLFGKITKRSEKC